MGFWWGLELLGQRLVGRYSQGVVCFRLLKAWNIFHEVLSDLCCFHRLSANWGGENDFPKEVSFPIKDNEVKAIH